MSDLALTSSSSPTNDRPVRWLTVEEVAGLLSLSEGQVRRKCGEDWVGLGLARTVQRENKRSQWEIRSDADPKLDVSIRLAGKEAPRTEVIRTGDLMKNTPAAAKAMFKAAILDRWERARHAGAVLNLAEDAITDGFITELQREFDAKGMGKAPSRPTLYNWKRAAVSGEGIEGLADGRQLRKITSAQDKTSDPFFQCVKRLYMTTNENKLTKCYDTALYLARDQGWEIRSRSQVRRFIDSIDNREKILRRKGKEAFVNEVMPHHIGDYSTLEVNEMWVSDHHLFDVWVRTGERLDKKSNTLKPIHSRVWLTVWMDMRSRKIVAWMIREGELRHPRMVSARVAKIIRTYQFSDQQLQAVRLEWLRLFHQAPTTDPQIKDLA